MKIVSAYHLYGKPGNSEEKWNGSFRWKFSRKKSISKAPRAREARAWTEPHS